MKRLVLLWRLTVLVASPAIAGQAVLSWDPPTTNTDGSWLTDLGGYRLYYGTASGNYGSVIDAGNVITHTVTGLSNGTYYFVVTAYDTSGNESGFSNEVSKTISGAPPTSIPASTGIQVSVSGGTVAVSWDKSNSSSVSGYQIQRGPTATLFNATYDIGLGYADSAPCVVSYSGCARRQFIFNGVLPGTYFWRVTAYDSTGTFGEASSTASVTISSDTTVPADVTNFSAVKYGTGTRLSWTNPSNPDFYGLLLEYSFNNSAGPWVLLANLRGIPGVNQTYDHLILIAGTYYYRIHTKDTSGNVTSTEYADVTLSAPPDDTSTAEIQTPPQTTTTSPVQKKEKESDGFGCGTISNSPPSGGNGTDASAVTLVATLLFLLYCRATRRLALPKA